jgi:hypothetical protein
MSVLHKRDDFSKPYIFVLDLDGTIIGDCSYQSDIFNIQEIIKQSLVDGNFKKNEINLITKHKTLCDQTMMECYNSKSKLIRPFFGSFINKIKKMYPNSFFFIYTASEKKWAIKEIKMIEAQNKIKFDRPIFTRSDCIFQDGEYKKSIEHVKPQILKAIKAKKTLDIRNNILIIDNNPTFIDYKDNLLICPTYDYIHFKNLWENIPNEYMKIDKLKSIVSRLIGHKKMYGTHDKNNAKIMERIHRWLYKKYKIINKFNATYENDTFWKDLYNMIVNNKIQIINKSIVETMQKSIKVR